MNVHGACRIGAVIALSQAVTDTNDVFAFETVFFLLFDKRNFRCRNRCRANAVRKRAFKRDKADFGCVFGNVRGDKPCKAVLRLGSDGGRRKIPRAVVIDRIECTCVRAACRRVEAVGAFVGSTGRSDKLGCAFVAHDKKVGQRRNVGVGHPFLRHTFESRNTVPAQGSFRNRGGKTILLTGVIYIGKACRIHADSGGFADV